MITFFFIIVALIATVTILITNSTLKIDIKEFIVINKELTKFKLTLSLNLFKKIKWLRLTIDNQRLKRLGSSTKIKKFKEILDTKISKKYKITKQMLAKNWKKILTELDKVELEKIKLEAEIGTDNAAITALTAGTLSAALGIILARKTSLLQYTIKPKYINKNYLYLSANCIISLKLVHIISVRKELKRKEVYQ